MRVLLVADTHIGFDLPLRPRVQRRRRGHDFLANIERALAPARAGEVDLVVHGGDLMHRSQLPAGLVETALEPLVRVAEGGVPVCLVPGNHERSRVPRTLLTSHPGLHVLDRPRTVVLDVGGATVAVAGFPFDRHAGERFEALVAATGWSDVDADIRLLCLHQAVEGATVGPSGFTFRRSRDVVPGRLIPAGFAAVLTGHIHRSQVLTHDLAGREMAAPVIYPGSVERTSFAERDETKHFAVVELAPDRGSGGKLVGVDLRPLPARPMVTLELDASGLDAPALTKRLSDELADLPADAVVRVRVEAVAPGAEAALSAARLRALAPPTMNVTLAGAPWRPSGRARHARAERSAP